MTFEFCCPQGHVLQGELSQVGQLLQCPMCGSSFLVPPPTMDPGAMGGPGATGGFFQGPGTWPAPGAFGPSPAPQGGMPGMLPPQNTPLMPGSPMPAGPMPAGPYPGPAPQPFAYGPPAVNPAAPAAPAAELAPIPQQPAESPASDAGRPKFDLGFDPSAKAALPFDLPGAGESAAEQTPAAPLPPPAFPAPSFPMQPLPPTGFPAPSMPVTFEPSAGNQDFLQSAPKVSAEQPWSAGSQPAPDFLQSVPASSEEAAENRPTLLHIRCPSGHLVKATSDLLGKNGRCPACKKTFELRYEDSVEFQRRTQKILHREEIKTGQAWIAWAFLAAFFVFAGLVGLIILINR